jgi:hypothetical protein
MQPPDLEMRNPAKAATKARAISQTNSSTADIATNEKANQPKTALAAAFKAARRKAVAR